MIRAARYQGNHARIYRGAPSLLAPLTDGKGRCPCCRRPVTLTSTGRCFRHRDTAGAPCGGGGMEPSEVAA